MKREQGGGPLYERVKLYVLEKIQRGEWPPGTHIPAEQELVQTLEVSRMTVHRALRELSTEGVLSRTAGVGTFVSIAAPRPHLLEIRDIAEDISSRGQSYSAVVVSLEAIRATLDLATFFGLKPGAKLFHSVVVHFEDGCPIQLEGRYVNPVFAPAYLDQDFTQQTTTNYLRGITPATEVEHFVFAVLPDPEAQKLLQIEPDEPCILVVRHTWIDTLPVTKTLFTCPGSRFSLSTRQKF
ncbi:histidine utilization repressor [Paraburkholderia fungorum]|uniref:histidine utilization repressor n=1 Tax=Paraburkholderia fungorum TaxID=134537 RepID=UPI00402B3C3E